MFNLQNWKGEHNLRNKMKHTFVIEVLRKFPYAPIARNNKEIILHGSVSPKTTTYLLRCYFNRKHTQKLCVERNERGYPRPGAWRQSKMLSVFLDFRPNWGRFASLTVLQNLHLFFSWRGRNIPLPKLCQLMIVVQNLAFQFQKEADYYAQDKQGKEVKSRNTDDAEVVEVYSTRGKVTPFSCALTTEDWKQWNVVSLCASCRPEVSPFTSIFVWQGTVISSCENFRGAGWNLMTVASRMSKVVIAQTNVCWPH